MIPGTTRKKFGKCYFTYWDGVSSKEVAQKDAKLLMYKGLGVHVEHDPDYIGPFPWKIWVRELKGR